MATTVPAGKVGTPLITLIANTEEVVSFTDNIGRVEVVSPATNTVDAWFSVDGSAASVAGAGCYYLPAGSVVALETVNIQTGGTFDQVRLISTGTPTVRVQQTGRA